MPSFEEEEEEEEGVEIFQNAVGKKNNSTKSVVAVQGTEEEKSDVLAPSSRVAWHHTKIFIQTKSFSSVMQAAFARKPISIFLWEGEGRVVIFKRVVHKLLSTSRIISPCMHT